MVVVSAFLKSNMRNYLNAVRCCCSRINIWIHWFGRVYTALPQHDFSDIHLRLNDIFSSSHSFSHHSLLLILQHSLITMKSKSVMAASAMMELALAQASADPLCSTIINLQPIEYQFQQPILIDSYFPANTDIVLDDGKVVHVTNAPTSLSTVLTDVSTSLTTLSRFVRHVIGSYTKLS